MGVLERMTVSAPTGHLSSRGTDGNSGLDGFNAFARATVHQPPGSLLRVIQFRGGTITYDRDELVLSMGMTANHRLEYTIGRSSVSVVPLIGRFGLMTPGQLFRVSLQGDCSVIQMVLPRALLSAWLSEDHGVDGDCVEIVHGHTLDDPVVSQLIWAARIAGPQEERSILRFVAARLLEKFSHKPQPITPARGGLSEHKLRRIIDRIEAEPARPTSVEDLAREVSMSPYHFAHQFTRATGRPPYRFILERRLSRAVALLSDSKLTIADIAARCGFAHPSHLSRQLQRVLGQSPAQMRHAISS